MDECTEIGERELIRRITRILGGVVNDDCAVIDSGEKYLVATTDMLHRKSDFPDIMTPWQIGWMTVAVNLSDIAAMGAQPSGLLVASGIPQDADISLIDGIFEGLRDCAAAYGTSIIGGDMDSTDELNLTACALGFVEKDLILRRSGAVPGDLLCTTGTLGAAGAGLKAWQEGDLGSKLIKSLLEPKPRIDEGRALAKSRAVTAMMDNSDGLALSLSDLSEVSGVGFEVSESLIPLAPGLEDVASQEEAVDMVLRAGGDFELIFTVRPDRIGDARKACPLTVIGSAVSEGLWMVSGGRRHKLSPRGYEHSLRRCGPGQKP
jgi:thiamine-monophosphate kinase